jgi:hypothetical protein
MLYPCPKGYVMPLWYTFGYGTFDLRVAVLDELIFLTAVAKIQKQLLLQADDLDANYAQG